MANPTFTVSGTRLTEGAPLTLTFTRLQEATRDRDLTIYVSSDSLTTNSADSLDYTLQNATPVTIPAGSFQQTLSLSTFRDGTYEGTEKMDFLFSDRASNYTLQQSFDLLDADPAPAPVIAPTQDNQYITVKMLDSNIEVTEGQTAVIRMEISGNKRGGQFSTFMLPNTLGAQIGPGTDFSNDNPTWDAYALNLAPGQTYAEFRMNIKEDTLRENDKTNIFGAWLPDFTTFRDRGNNTFIKFEGTTSVTLRDNDWGASQPDNPPININGDNNTVNVYNDNRSYVNSFNVNNTLNQTYVNSFNGTAGKDTLTGTTENDQLAGGNGNDTLNGNAGADNLIGGNGKDQLFGGTGSNVLNGGTGKDIYNVSAESDATADILQGLTRQDRIVILGGSNLTFQQMDDGIGIFNNGTLQALAQGGLGLDTVRSLTTASAA